MTHRGGRYRDPSDYALSCRIFVGNLASERTSREELTKLFSKYGGIVDIVLRKSFGFIQFDTPKAAKDAIEYENGRLLGGLNLDLNMADSRDREKERENREKGIESRKRRGVDKSRSPSPLGKRGPRKIVQIIYLGLAVKTYGLYIEGILKDRLPSPLRIETVLVERRSVEESLRRADERGIRYVIVVGRHHEENRIVSLNIIRDGQSEAIDDIFLQRAMAVICQEEGKQQYHLHAPLPPYSPKSDLPITFNGIPHPGSSMSQAVLAEAFGTTFSSQPGLVQALQTLMTSHPELTAAFGGATPMELAAILANPQTAGILRDLARLGGSANSCMEGGMGGVINYGGNMGRNNIDGNTGGNNVGGNMGSGLSGMSINMGRMSNNDNDNNNMLNNFGVNNMGSNGLDMNIGPSNIGPNNYMGSNIGQNDMGGGQNMNMGRNNMVPNEPNIGPMGPNFSSNMGPNMGGDMSRPPAFDAADLAMLSALTNTNDGGNYSNMNNNYNNTNINNNSDNNNSFNNNFNNMNTNNNRNFITNYKSDVVSDLVSQQANLQANLQNLISRKQPFVKPPPVSC